MHDDYNVKNQDQKVLYETYRSVVNSMNIGFMDDTPEKCGTCLEYDVNPTPENTLLEDMHLLKVNPSDFQLFTIKIKFESDTFLE